MPEKGMWTLWDHGRQARRAVPPPVSQSSEGGSELPDSIQGLRVLK